jgi:hypothetical protein
MPDQRPLQWKPKSERVVQLLAASIRAAVRLRYARDISRDDSIDMARAHDLPSALRTIAVKMEVHENLPDDHGFDLADAETKLTSESHLGTEKIVEIRRASLSTLESSQSNSSDRQFLIAGLHAVQQEARSWAKAYSRFLTEMETLYKSTRTRIDGLNLPLGKRLQAQSELEQMIVNAIKQAQNC